MDNNQTPVSFTKNDVEMIEKKQSYNGFFSITKCIFRYRLFNGEMSNAIIREVFEKDPVIILLPYDPFSDEIVLIEQLRIPTLDVSKTPWLLEVVAGIMEGAETPEQAAQREATEEIGLDIKRFKSIINFFSSPGVSSEHLSFIVGEVDLNFVKKNYIIGDEKENIAVHITKREQAYYWMQKGIIQNAASIIAIQWLTLNYKELQKEWK